MKSILFFAAVLPVAFLCVVANIDLPVYNIKIKKEPVKLSEITGPYFHVVSVKGQRFSCIVPNTTKQQEYFDLVPKNTSDHIRDIFATWDASNCLEWLGGWWTYKLCIGKEVFQYHEDQGAILTSSSLGLFSKEFDWTLADKTDLQVRNKYHSQFYDRGTVCDVTGKPRSTEVRFICNYYTPTPTIVEVSEISTCSYVIRVSTADLCAIPPLIPSQEMRPGDIVCSPSMSDESYLKFVEVQNRELVRRKKVEEERSFQDIKPFLRARRRALRERVLFAHRTYRKRLELEQLHRSRKIRRQCLEFLQMIENNLDPDSSTLPNGNLPHSKFVALNFDEWHPDSLLQLFKSIFNFRVPFANPRNGQFELDTIFQNKLGAHNQTLEIAYLLLHRMRTAFENSLGVGQRPKTMKILNGFLDILYNLGRITSTRSLVEVRLAIATYRPRRLSRSVSEYPDFIGYYQSPQLAVERSVFNALNSSILLSRNAINLIYLQMRISRLLGSEYLNKFPEVFSDELASPSVDLQGINAAAFTKAVNLFQEALGSPKLQSILKFLTAKTKQAVVFKLGVRDSDDDDLALIISFGDEKDTNANHEENVKNYGIKINLD